MFKGVKGIVALTAAAVAVVAIAYAGYVSTRGQPPAGQIAAASDPANRLRVTLDPGNFQGIVREAYEIAARQPTLLAQLHCYCGCDRTLAHKSLLDCYRDLHGSHCEVCVAEAHDAASMASKGAPVEQIRDALRARYAHGS
jgi:hypothetical protein